jgi:ABC-type Fe3+/spermidine/putrescine transport system ATPase subunit
MSDLQVRNIEKSFGENRVLSDISFSVKEGNFLSLLGPSGCGKTTILRIVAGLEYADAGSILVDGTDISKVPVEKRNIGVVFQNYALIPHMTVHANIAYGLKLRRMEKSVIEEKVKEYIALVGLEGLADRRIPQLSGGQQQRVALARALIIEPRILLLDEPLSALDRKIRSEMQYEVRRIQQQVGITTLFVTHDQEEALTMSDEILLMRAGRIEQLSDPKEMYTHPVSLYASDFLGKANTLAGTLRGGGGSGDGNGDGDGWYIQGDGWRLPALYREGFADGEEVAVAIRGEHFRLGELSAAVDGSVDALVQDIVFTGAICRINALLGGEEIAVSCLGTDADDIAAGQTIRLTVDPGMVHYFHRADEDGAD